MFGQKLGHQVTSKKKVVYALEAIFSVQYSWKLLRMFALIISWMSLKVGHVGSESRSLGQILEKPCVRCRGLKILKIGHDGWKTRLLLQILEKPCVSSRSHIFCLMLLKVGQNLCLDDIWVAFENGSCGVKN